jgi:hypothetical protein
MAKDTQFLGNRAQGMFLVSFENQSLLDAMLSFPGELCSLYEFIIKSRSCLVFRTDISNLG